MATFAQQRFAAPISALSDILSKGRYHKDKGEGFYKAHSRDVIFRLEALCRLYREVLDKKFFDKWYKEFKVLEDALGSMDHHEAMWNEFSAHKELKRSAQLIFKKRYTEESIYVSELLRDEGWLSGAKLKQFNDGLNQTDWKDDEQDRIAYATVFNEELDKLTDKYANGEIDVSKLEEGVHEFRRRLRWVSIYAQVANGLIQLRKVNVVNEDLMNYSTDSIANSPFNQLPKPIKGQEPIIVQSHYFYALSWMVQYLADLKDIGLRNEAFLELKRHSKIKDAKVSKRFLDTCAIHPDDISALAEIGIDDFIYRDFIPERICRDVMRGVQ
ncbi:MAG: hypothetical protein SH856_11675 [Flavobacteriales bacterium]|nr:hypothetical protein [Flavobacteriales bacterium]